MASESYQPLAFVHFPLSSHLLSHIFFKMRSSAILLAALLGVASAAVPQWPRKLAETGTAVYSAGVGPTGTGKPHLGPGPVSFSTGSPIHHTTGGILPSGGYTHKPTGSGWGPTGTGHGGSPPPTPGPHTTTITKTGDVTSEWLITQILLTRSNTPHRHNDLHTLRHHNSDVYDYFIRTMLDPRGHTRNIHLLLDLVDHDLLHYQDHSN